MASVSHTQPPPNSYSHVNLRRHSSAHPENTPTSRNGSASSTKSQPAWMSSIQKRDREETQSSGFKGLFGHRKSSASKKEEKIVIGSKHAGQVKNNLRADPRGARKHGSAPIKTAGVQGAQKSAHLTAEQQEMRHPHSGPPALKGTTDLPLLTRIVSGDEEDPWDHEEARAQWEMKKLPDVERVEEERNLDVDVGGVQELRVRTKSAEIKERKSERRKSMFGSWMRGEKGVWRRR